MYLLLVVSSLMKVSVASTHSSNIRIYLLMHTIFSYLRDASLMNACSFILRHDSISEHHVRNLRVWILGIFLAIIYTSSLHTDGQYDTLSTLRLVRFYAINLMQFCDIWHHSIYNTFNFLPSLVASIDMDESVRP